MGGLSLASLFDGIGGFPYAASFYGITPAWASEILPQAVSVTMRHFPAMAHMGDITRLDGAKLPPVDIVTFGSPCQDLSTAGKRAGMKGERSGLFTEAIRIIDEMREATDGRYPRYALWENVPGAMSSGKPTGSDFRAVLEAFTKTEIPMPASGKWANAGMARGGNADIAWRVLNAQYHGVPQRRRRVFLVCDFRGTSAGEVLFVEEGLRGHPAPGGQARQGTAADAQRGAGGAGAGLTPWDVSGCLPTGQTGGTGSATERPSGASRRVHDESGAWPALYGGEGNGHGYAAMAGGAGANCLTPWDTQQSRVFTTDGVAPTAAGADGRGGRNPAGLVFCPELGRCGPDTAQTLTSADGNGARNPPGLVFCEPDTARTLTASGDASPCADRGQNVVAVPAVSVHQDGSGALTMAGTAKSLTTIGTASCRNAPLVCEVSGVTSKGDGDCFLTPECHPALSQGGGQAGQGYPAVLAAHPKVGGTLCASGAGLSRPAGMASEPDLCVAYALQGNMIGRKEKNGPGGSGVNENISYTLTERDTPAIASAIPIHDKATRYKGGGPTRSGDGCGNGLGIGKEDGPAPTLTSGDHHAVAAIPINTQLAMRHGALGEGTGFGIGQGGSPAYTIQKSHSHAVAAVFNRQRSDHFKEQDLASTQAARQHKDATDVVCEVSVSAVDCRNYKETGDISGTLQAKDKPGYSLNYQNPVRAGYIVRRLTPTECERLQGFPDGWTRFGHDGREISDTKRYQMLGNSVAVPCVRYILHGMAAQMFFGNHE